MISNDDGNDVMQTHDGIMSSFEDLVNTISTGWRRNRKDTLSVEPLQYSPCHKEYIQNSQMHCSKKRKRKKEEEKKKSEGSILKTIASKR